MHIIKTVRMILQDKTDTKYDIDEKLKLIDDSILELTPYIPETKKVTITSTTHIYDVPVDFYEVLSLNYGLQQNTSMYIFPYTKTINMTPEGTFIEGTDFKIIDNQIVFEFGISGNLELEYYAKLPTIKVDYAVSSVTNSTTIHVADTIDYVVGQVLLVGTGVEEKEVIVLEVIDDTDLRLNLNVTIANGSKIIFDYQGDIDDKKIIEYNTAIVESNLTNKNMSGTFSWKTDKISESVTAFGANGGKLTLTGTNKYGALQKALRVHKRYKFKRNRMEQFTAIL